jgi:hypothetical protein|tara:strand:+ start:252 stop:761 length:510 start_codon:yes stop_codon:yes gene_type:complete
MSDFNLHIIDNFLPNDVYNDILNHIPNIEWDGMNHIYNDKPEHVWYSQNIENSYFSQNIKEAIRKNSIFPIKEFHMLSFTLATKVKAFPHTDASPQKLYENQLLLYIDGNNDMNKGTGFYVKNGDNYDLNTHIGFYKNRALLFKAGVWHSPLLFNAKDSIPRISIIAQF